MVERPGWIEALFQSNIGAGCFETRYARFRQDLLRKTLEDHIPSEPGSTDELRRAALDELGGHDSARVERALAYLMVVGRARDANAVEPLRRSQDDLVRNGAKTCFFKLRRRSENS